MEVKSIGHLEAIREDIRDEIKKRIQQRDQYSIQLTIALGTTVAISFSPKGFGQALIAAPLFSIYYSVLILYSYRVHKLLARYLREEIEPELARLCKIAPSREFETWYAVNTIPGIRKAFFLVSLWVICILTPAYLWMTESGRPEFKIIIIVSGIVYLLATISITIAFRKS